MNLGEMGDIGDYNWLFRVARPEVLRTAWSVTAFEGEPTPFGVPQGVPPGMPIYLRVRQEEG